MLKLFDVLYFDAQTFQFIGSINYYELPYCMKNSVYPDKLTYQLNLIYSFQEYEPVCFKLF